MECIISDKVERKEGFLNGQDRNGKTISQVSYGIFYLFLSNKFTNIIRGCCVPMRLLYL